MEYLSKLIPDIISRLLSLLESSRLRHDYYEILEEHEIMWTALNDISRMGANTPSGRHADKTKDLINLKHRTKHKNYRIGEE